jgi:hypothetical protein
VEAHVGVRAELGGDVELVQERVEVLVAGFAEGGDRDVQDLALGRAVAEGVAAHPPRFLEQDDVVLALEVVAGGQPGDAAADDGDPAAGAQRSSGL